ncbi:YbgF trimerization domain-containing protein [Gilvimarinus algae]|uniref:YbgF trimerization domain-containing protein n=1 Tax=Gilvimarinus algae TaxID=3058037 RepID=A0ABT8TIH5_9GAMM|nr:YbgF trimerization domain-containing protein [Gilvimarinus sp. SDUM040014]MDO3382122.1 YbgF trimerization domain-containing protein [Gilvimarinus sp. SDUM040014]
MNKPLMLAAAIAAAFTSSVQAQVQVIDSSPQAARPSANAGQSPNANQQAELFYQLQTLQQEVMNLRGMVEEQAFEIKRLKQQRLDDYLDLDRRVSALTTGGSFSSAPAYSLPPAGTEPDLSAQSTPVTAPSATDTAPQVPLAADGRSEADVYGAAYDLLKQRQVDASIAAFKDHLARFPRGEYAGNSYYWLGEIYLLKNDLPAAQQWFGDLLAEFPDNRKVPDAQFKLGKVYHLQGNDARAKELLSIVASSNADASRLADQYLKENF